MKDWKWIANVTATVVFFTMLAMIVLGAQGPGLGSTLAVLPLGDKLTELDTLRIENANLFEALTTFVEESDNCRGLLAKPRAEANRREVSDRRAKLKSEIEAAHRGFTWDAATGALTPTPPQAK